MTVNYYNVLLTTVATIATCIATFVAYETYYSPLKNENTSQSLKSSVSTDLKKITSKGIGIVNIGNSNKSQAVELAKRAAVINAKRNILEKSEIQITSKTHIEGGVVTKDEIKSIAHGLVKKSKIIEVREIEDGVFEAELEVNFD